VAELPITTALMLRSIADIAHSQGEDLATVEGRFACLQVFALGARSREDNAAETGYYGLRATLAFHFLESAGDGGVNIPAAIDAVRAIAARLGVVISDQAAAQMIPIAGAASGALVNLSLLQHFQDIARGHFPSALEREYGSTDPARLKGWRAGGQEPAGVQPAGGLVTVTAAGRAFPIRARSLPRALGPRSCRSVHYTASGSWGLRVLRR
jgi:hypothetical protein